MAGEDCRRRRVVISGRNYYLTVGKTFAHITVPYENRIDMSKEREVVETLCEEISAVLQEINTENLEATSDDQSNPDRPIAS